MTTETTETTYVVGQNIVLLSRHTSYHGGEAQAIVSVDGQTIRVRASDGCTTTITPDDIDTGAEAPPANPEHPLGMGYIVTESGPGGFAVGTVVTMLPSDERSGTLRYRVRTLDGDTLWVADVAPRPWREGDRARIEEHPTVPSVVGVTGEVAIDQDVALGISVAGWLNATRVTLMAVAPEPVIQTSQPVEEVSPSAPTPQFTIGGTYVVTDSQSSVYVTGDVVELIEQEHPHYNGSLRYRVRQGARPTNWVGGIREQEVNTVDVTALREEVERSRRRIADLERVNAAQVIYRERLWQALLEKADDNDFSEYEEFARDFDGPARRRTGTISASVSLTSVLGASTEMDRLLMESRLLGTSERVDTTGDITITWDYTVSWAHEWDADEDPTDDIGEDEVESALNAEGIVFESIDDYNLSYDED